MKGRLIVIEGIDGSGKATQSAMLTDHLIGRGVKARRITFPDYDSESSALVKMYLRGDFGESPDAVNAYAASSFYAVDRFANYQMYWREAYLNGETIVSDRYTTSNAVHQMAKIPKDQWDQYLDWLYDFEFERMEIPDPDVVFYLDLSPETAARWISSRYKGNEMRKDLHEKDLRYMRRCREAAIYAVGKLGWKRIQCEKSGIPYSIEQIHKKIVAKL